MSILNSFLNLIQKAVLVMFIIPAAFKLIEFVHRFVQQFNQMQVSLKDAETQIRVLSETIDDLRAQTEDHNRLLQTQITSTLDIKKQLIDQNIDAIDTTKDIGDIYECLDLLDDRLLEFARTHKTKKQIRREKKEIEMTDHRNPTEECFDEFIADCLVYDPAEKIRQNELNKLFQEWCAKTHQKINTTEIELEGYMIRNFGPPEESEDSHKVSRKENKRGSSWTGLKSKSKSK